MALIDTDGDVIERYGYDAFGVPSFFAPDGTPLDESAVGNTVLYTGRQWLPELGVYDFRHRLYDPSTGRFLTTDPVYDPANLGNPYTYVGNNPGAFVDPLGLSWDRLAEPAEKRGFWSHVGSGFKQLWEDIWGSADDVGGIVASQNPAEPLTSFDVIVNRQYLTPENALDYAGQGVDPRYSAARGQLDALEQATAQTGKNLATEAAISAATAGIGRFMPHIGALHAADDVGEAGAGAARRAGKASSARLARNLEKAGISRPPGFETHHIVPKAETRFRSAVASREILERFGIDLDDVANGVFLPGPRVANPGRAFPHRSLQTREYYDAVYEALFRADTRDKVLQRLQGIGRQLERGEFSR